MSAQPIKGVWEARRLTQRDLAQHVEMHFTTLNDIMQGRQRPSREQRQRLAKFFGLPESELFDEWALQ